MTTIGELARGLSEATGPSRELDCLLEIAFGKDGPAIEKIMAGSPHNTIDEIATAADREGTALFFRVPRYTASIDAAMALAEPGHHLAYDVHFMDDEGVIRYRGYSFQPDWAKWNPHDMEWLKRDGDSSPLCATPALCVCLAALRAHLTKGQTHEG